MSYCHLTIAECSKIEVLKGLGYSCRAIARHLNRSHTTISCEVKRLNEGSAKKGNVRHHAKHAVVSARGTKGCMATFAERKTRFYVGVQILNRSAQSMKWAIEQLLSCYPRQCFQTFTTDRGKEFSYYTELETQYGMPFYFADPYAPWQRGTNENSSLLREFFPKRMDLGQLTSSKIEQVLSLINNRSRKCLNWNTTQDLFDYEVVQLI
ncbi:Integrase core domain protein [Metalysinibacillus saudimassiliensis]|uniref:Integrase core domain protein n=1 Tax=Metalysinibacillus saudimassiliensis TaxID=1461583 RepID=A0A078MHX4_9BACL|nr:Integrase core domain protein [Metalysinibacillus saudimassiliensis]